MRDEEWGFFVDLEVDCENIITEDDCNNESQCSFCISDKLETKCYNKHEANVLSHISNTENKMMFECGNIF